MTEDTALDTTIHEPSMTAGEVEVLLFALDRSRAPLAWKCGGLDAAGLRKPHPPPTMTLGGLLKHLALVEDMKVAAGVTGRPLGPPWDARDAEENWAWACRTADEDSPGSSTRSGAAPSSGPAPRGLGRSPTEPRPALDVHPAVRRCAQPPSPRWTCTTSTPATSAMRTYSVRPLTAWERTRRSQDDGYPGADPGREAGGHTPPPSRPETHSPAREEG